MGKSEEILLPELLKKIFLYDFHKSIGAKFAPFSGYSMPINYKEGIIKEHLHTRKHVGFFDVTHMGQCLIPFNEDNINKLEKIIPLDLKEMKLSTSSYSFILNENGGIIDDIIISKLNYDNSIFFFIVYNAGRKSVDEEIFNKTLKNIIFLKNNSLLAIQGPLASSILSFISESIINLKFMEIKVLNYKNHKMILSRSGYTGEDGFEISVPNDIANNFLEDLLKNKNIMFCGLGSRDSLRLEAGLSLYGHELNENLSPVEANLTWAINKIRLELNNFNGSQIIINQISKGIQKVKIGIKSKSKSILRSKMTLLNNENNEIGYITSGGFSPTLSTSIAIAYVDKNFYNNKLPIYCNIRNQNEEVDYVNLPFVPHKYKKG
tara:strand:- start:4050 stop:5183 length:1134 start_codon:yes stop_codon:yes gene_type:complete